MRDGDLEQLGREVLEIYGAVCNRVLRIAQTALPESQFLAFRRLVLDEFGEQGATKKIKQLFKLSPGNGTEGNGGSSGLERAGASAKIREGGGDNE